MYPNMEEMIRRRKTPGHSEAQDRRGGGSVPAPPSSTSSDGLPEVLPAGTSGEAVTARAELPGTVCLPFPQGEEEAERLDQTPLSERVGQGGECTAPKGMEGGKDGSKSGGLNGAARVIYRTFGLGDVLCDKHSEKERREWERAADEATVALELIIGEANASADQLRRALRSKQSLSDVALSLEKQALRASESIRDLESRVAKLERDNRGLEAECMGLRAALRFQPAKKDAATSPVRVASSHGGGVMPAGESLPQECMDVSGPPPEGGGWETIRGKKRRRGEGGRPEGAVSAVPGAAPLSKRKKRGEKEGGKEERGKVDVAGPPRSGGVAKVTAVGPLAMPRPPPTEGGFRGKGGSGGWPSLPTNPVVAINLPGGPPASYAGALRKAKEELSLGELGLKPAFVRRATGGGLLIGVGGQGSPGELKARADTLAGRLREVMPGARVTRPDRRGEVRLVGVDETALPEEVRDALAACGNCGPQDVLVGPIRPGRWGGVVWARLPLAAALQAAKKGRVELGWSAARVEMLGSRPLQCYRCWGFGHARASCPGAARDRGSDCFRCGRSGHTARECANSVSCAVCQEAGRNAGHRMGGPACEAAKSGRPGRRPRRRRGRPPRGGKAAGPASGPGPETDRAGPAAGESTDHRSAP